VSLPNDVVGELREAAAASTQRQRDNLVRRAEQAIGAYEAGRFQEALRLAKGVLAEAPNVSAITKVAGLAAYRVGKWREAIPHLERYAASTGTTDQTPALMDCYRALGRTNKVAELWSDLRRASPGTDVIAEARIVGAGALADKGDLGGAISLLTLGGSSKALRNPAERHIRQWYVLADLYERAGDVPRARELFMRVARAEPDAYDVQSRLESLGRQRRPGRRRTTTQLRPSDDPSVAGARDTRASESPAGDEETAGDEES